MNEDFNNLLGSYSKTKIATAIAALTTLSILAKTYEVPIPDSGICANWQKQIQNIDYSSSFKVYTLVNYGAMTWSLSAEPGKHTSYPIYDDQDSKWEGRSLKLRLSLIKHLLDGLKAYQKTMT